MTTDRFGGVRVGSVASGYGGLDMAVLAVFGGELVWWSDIEDGPIAVMSHRHPGVPNLGDVREVDWTRVPSVDVLTAGYPCQPFSVAGRRKGTDDPRHIWPHVERAVGVLRPRLVVLENVAGHLRLGFDVVLAGLAGLGYDATWGLVRASDVGAPHRRERLFVVAQDPNVEPCYERGAAEPREAEGRRAWADTGGRGGGAASDPGGTGLEGSSEQAWGHNLSPGGGHRTSPDPDRHRLRHEPGRRSGQSREDTSQPVDTDQAARFDWREYGPAVERWERILGRPAPHPAIAGPRGGVRVSPVFVEWMMGLPEGWVTDVPGLTVSTQLRLLGNGVVPQQAAAAIRMLAPMLAGGYR